MNWLVKIVSVVLKDLKLYTKPVFGTVIPSTSAKQKEDCTTGSPSISKLTQVGHASAVADHTISTGHNIKWDHFEVLATEKSDLQRKIKANALNQ